MTLCRVFVPDLRSAGSRVSTLLVAAITYQVGGGGGGGGEGGVWQSPPATYLDLAVGAEAVELVEQLQHGPLHLPVSLLLTGKPLHSHGERFITSARSNRNDNVHCIWYA